MAQKQIQKNSGLSRIQTHDVCVDGAVYQGRKEKENGTPVGQ